MNGPVLRDIHLPPAHWWPLAAGWWLLAALLALAGFGVAWWLRRVARTLPLRAAMREIDALEAAYARDGDAGQLVDGASRLMRRVALRVAPGAAAQTGATWCAFVHTHAADAGTRQVLDQLASERFRAQPVLDAPVLLSALRAWCRDALRTRASTPFHGKGVAPEARGVETPVQYTSQKSAA
ncbi:MAG: DUF4381 domain-containing protein [Pseudomonadota bacterium]